MRLKCFGLVLLLGLLVQETVLPQSNLPPEARRASAAPEEIVSFSRSTSFANALLIIGDLSKKFAGKMILGQEIYSGSIGVDINKQHWMTALEMILRQNGLWYEEYADYIRLVPFAKTPAQKPAAPATPAEDPGKSREVVISAIFFDADIAKLRQAGMSWDFFYSKDLNMTAANNAVDARGGLFQVDIDPALDFADITATFKALESNQLGEVITSPQITVRSGETGRIQVGSDISVTLQDFSGNTVTQFFSTGSIIEVTPEVVIRDSLKYIKLQLSIERSRSAVSESGGLEILKSSAETAVLLLDGEETIIGGLFSNEESRVREGIPFLKDLPWWFFGLRYVFGFESKSYKKKELLILIKGEILPTLEERFKAKKRDFQYRNLLKEGRFQFQQKLDNYNRQSKDKK